MPIAIHHNWALQVSYCGITALTDLSFDGGIDPRTVMAEQSFQDVVKQEQSVDDPSFTDVSATQTTDSAARAAPDVATKVHVDTIPTSLSANTIEHIQYHDDQFTATKDTVIPEVLEAANTLTVNDSEPAHPTESTEVHTSVHQNELQSAEIVEDDSAKGLGVDGSGGSDTDTSRVDISDAAGKDLEDGQEQVRPNALKKSATFKPVSVTKSFLAKAGTATTPTAKLGGDKVNGMSGPLSNSAAQSMPRPRLVAKSASGTRNSIPKALIMGSKTGKGAGPDPNQVWNRNRVSTPQATPKHLTDEELRQQYGIQLASRPQEDADGKEAKWADIDDDEDDWAPETIEWNDGTKINLSQIDHKAAVVAEQAAAAAAKEKASEAAKPKFPILKPISTVGPNATILKLGSSTLPKSGGLVLKGPSDKPTLVAKPSSNQVKSPWASLPPVEKMSPVPINPQVQTPISRFTQKDVHGFDAMPPQPTLAKEIAADDFSRASRETPNGIPRELFNSQSGRYEPVKEARRGSTTRKEQNFRAPSVLQRPSQAGERGPAEPSAAFQTSRSGQPDAASWSRRRTSSNVSGESGQFGRRESINKGFDVPRMPSDLQQRRDSQYEQSPLTPGIHSARFGHRDVSPVHSHGQSITSQSPTIAVSQHLSLNESATASPQLLNAQPVIPPTPTSAVPDPDTIATQKRLMREKREAAIKRKAEEEAKEEAERRERIRIKMEKLGLVDGKMGKKEQAEEALSLPAASKEIHEEQVSTPRSPPKPPVPNASGVPQQYGLMKVHASHPVNGLPATSAPTERKPLELMRPKEDLPSPLPAAESTLPEDIVVPHLNGDIKPIEKEIIGPPSPEPRHQETTPDARQQSWKAIQQGANGFSTWNNTGMTTHSPPGGTISGSLWGPPANYKGIGNGDFQPNMQRQQSRQLPLQPHLTSSQPQPIGPPKHLQQSHGPQAQGMVHPSQLHVRSVEEEPQTVPSFPPTEAPPGNGTTQAQVQYQVLPAAPEPTKMVNQTRQAIPPTVVKSTRQMPQAAVQAPKSGLSAWANFGSTTAVLEADIADKVYLENVARIEEQRRTGISEAPLLTFNEKWRHVQTSDTIGQRQVVDTLKALQNVQALKNGQQSTGEMPVDVLSKTINAGLVAPQVRSRYQDIFEQNKRVVSAPIELVRTTSGSPPPPDSFEHPAYIATSQRPLVNLPGSKPKLPGPRPTVRLPPSVAAALQPSVSPEPRVANLRTVSQPLAASSSWQDRFNGLFDRKLSPEKKFAEISGFSSSKVPLEIVSVAPSAAVALPPKAEVALAFITRFATQEPPKTVEDEDALFEGRHFGSVPIVRVPAMAPVNAWNPSRPSQDYRARVRILSDYEIMTILPMLPGIDETQRASGLPIIIRIGSMELPTTKMLPRPTSNGNLRSKPQNLSKGKPRNNQKPRDSSASYNSPKPSQNGSGRSPVQAVSSQQSRPRGNNSNMSWARRASTAVS
ncbi:hypothetical protein MMC11_008093 [Xylographa trunciseda]|nr:hypothetical protein [Xylographa trunciseda]